MKTKLLTLTAVACIFVVTASNAQVPSYVPTNGLVGWWPFNGNANDESGNGNNGTVLGGAVQSADRFNVANRAYEVDGINCPTAKGISLPAFIDNSNSYTISCWYRTTDSTKTDQMIFNSYPHGYIAVNFNYPFANYNNRTCAFFGNGNWQYYGANMFWNTFQLNLWHNITVVKSVDSLKFYQDGMLSYNIQVPSNYNTGSFDSIVVGASSINAGSVGLNLCYETFKGSIDDIGIWNRALTQQEITALYTTCTKPEPVTLGTSATTERCPNDQVTIKVVTPAADASLNYQWTRNGTNMTGATSRSITVADAAKYKVFVRSGPGVDCQRVSGLIETTAAAPPTITATTPNGNAYCAGDSVLMSAIGITPGYSYQWKRFGVPIAGATSANFYAKQTGNYRCEVTNAGGCINQSNLITIVNGTSCRIMQDQSSDVSVYPNPAKNSFTVSFNDIGNEIPVSIELRNLQGQAVETRKLNGIADVQFNVSKLSPGVYMIRVMLEGGDVVEKSVVVE